MIAVCAFVTALVTALVMVLSGKGRSSDNEGEML